MKTNNLNKQQTKKNKTVTWRSIVIWFSNTWFRNKHW